MDWGGRDAAAEAAISAAAAASPAAADIDDDWDPFEPQFPGNYEAPEIRLLSDEMRELDDRLSRRPLDLDPAGYFVIFLDHQELAIVAQHYGNLIDERGRACDPFSGKVIPCDGSYKPKPTRVYRGRTAKELSVAILERPWKGMAGDIEIPGMQIQPEATGEGEAAGGGADEAESQRREELLGRLGPPVTMLVHANYLGRELQRAEVALVNGTKYVQD